jgi:mannose-6-phosphate isomerase-like protein (cupin superfamily)
MTEPVTTEKFLIRRLATTEVERGVCGWRRSLITAADGVPANASHLTIDNSRYHYHKQMTEYYYVLKGRGEMVLDGDSYPIEAGDLVLIRPGVRHTSHGDLEVLILGVPALETADVFFD